MVNAIRVAGHLGALRSSAGDDRLQISFRRPAAYLCSKLAISV